MRFLYSGHSQQLGNLRLEAALWVINIATVFFAARYLFEMNEPSHFLRLGPQSMLAFLASGIAFPTLFWVRQRSDYRARQHLLSTQPRSGSPPLFFDNALGRN